MFNAKEFDALALHGQMFVDTWGPMYLLKIPFQIYFTLCVITITSALLGRLSTRFFIVAVCICPFNHDGISKAGLWHQTERPGMKLAFQFIPKIFSGDEVRALCRQHHPCTLPCWKMFGLRPLIPVKGNCNAPTYQNIQYYTILFASQVTYGCNGQ